MYLEKMNQIKLDSRKVIEFLTQKQKYKTNGKTGLTTSLFFITNETFENPNSFNTRMFCLENGNLIDDSATGSTNGCFLAHLLKNKTSEISEIVEQGFQMERKSSIHLDEKLKNDRYSLKIRGKVVDLSKGK